MSARPPPEVIASFADGLSYSKTKLEELYRAGFFDPKPKKKPVAHPHKKEDVEFLMREFELSKVAAEKALLQNDGDLDRSVNYLMSR